MNVKLTKVRGLVNDRVPVQSEGPNRLALVTGMILIIAGVVTLVYFTSPIRILASADALRGANLLVVGAGSLSLAFGILILFLSRTRKA